MDRGGDDDNYDENELEFEEPNTTPQEDNTSPSKRKATKKAGRGPGKQLKSSTPMILEFDEHDLPIGEFEQPYGQNLGRCALRIDINIKQWSNVDEDLIHILWVETKKLFHIDDPRGMREKKFRRALSARFRQLKSRLVNRFIKKKSAPPRGNPNENKPPWEVYEGYITKEQWKLFEAYVSSDEFKMEHLEKEAKAKEEGAHTTLEYGVDALSKALGRKDYRGYVKGLGRSGVGVVHREAYGKTLKGKKYTEHEFEERINQIRNDFENRLQEMSNNFDKRLQEGLQVHLAKFSNMSANNMIVSSPNPPLQPLNLKEPRKCKLAVNDEDGNLMLVAEATAHPIHDGVVHTSQASREHYKVTVDKVFEEYVSVLLPIPPEEHITKLGEADQYFILWPMSMVIFEDSDEHRRTPKKITYSKSKEHADSWNPRTEESNVKGKDTVIDDGESLTEECSLLHILLVEEKPDTLYVPLKAPYMYSQTDTDVWVTYTDISEFLRGTSCA